MRQRAPWILALFGIVISLSGCGPETSSGGGEQMSYKDVKSMVIDILGSSEAQEALQKASTAKYGASGLHMQSLTPQDQEEVRTAVKDVLTSPEYDKILQGIMTDTKFAGEFAKAVSKDNKQLQKDLLKDPAYQKELTNILKGKEMQTVMFEAMKSTEYRTQMMSAVQEAVQNPIFKLELMKILQDVVKQELNPQTKDQAKKGGDSGGEGGGDSGGGGEGGEGGEGGG
ncbi:spore germination lipoprotein GerD [Cohnella thailandensis]|uniref:Spore gernimation protein n=1 Tax=Cohnella thailandensis TaxID=557557 RepID=A0A841T0R7_9BACL|nr:spore germination lipoprotein GerD [Cohnella thailandensis]MBB6636456.1 spore gernimation protein [Cohnella thailandensis]MBP1977672.1 spore germination protein D [Cohnella thailandensis]